MDPDANIIISSGCLSSEEEREALQGQARGFIQKPYDIARMLGTVRRILDECTAEGSGPLRPVFSGD